MSITEEFLFYYRQGEDVTIIGNNEPQTLHIHENGSLFVQNEILILRLELKRILENDKKFNFIFILEKFKKL